MSRIQMKQVRLSKDNQNTIGWIEDRGAKIGAEVELIGDGFWVVEEVFSYPMSKSDLSEHQKMHRNAFGSINK